MNKINIDKFELPDGISFVTIKHNKVYDRLSLGYEILDTIYVFKHEKSQKIYELSIRQDENGNIDLKWVDQNQKPVEETMDLYSYYLKPITDQLANKLF